MPSVLISADGKVGTLSDDDLLNRNSVWLYYKAMWGGAGAIGAAHENSTGREMAKVTRFMLYVDEHEIIPDADMRLSEFGVTDGCTIVAINIAKFDKRTWLFYDWKARTLAMRPEYQVSRVPPVPRARVSVVAASLQRTYTFDDVDPFTRTARDLYIMVSSKMRGEREIDFNNGYFGGFAIRAKNPKMKYDGRIVPDRDVLISDLTDDYKFIVHNLSEPGHYTTEYMEVKALLMARVYGSRMCRAEIGVKREPGIKQEPVDDEPVPKMSTGAGRDNASLLGDFGRIKAALHAMR
jgi:hypothetical protein